ncbi:Type IV secretory system Conjugative DNA transfer [Rathayibacter oskolensis]|uniref:Type IV secretory system Conjugative DNA transfer n=1 Tax=Rathayibacter oskolensis TaxID=1891671 RepID=A0A1X7N5G3_9MICO|nr:type IV secretory system conjugative DNA transfer family protein [Rathayibacter oskolensis]SMH32611.1 Type IV secretory system Conjugative DNA transfer [Rathayibacter oskolensis]
MPWIGPVWRASHAVATGMVRASENAATSIAAGLSSRAARRGVLGPGDAPPMDGGTDGYYDYRGVLGIGSVPPGLRDGEFPLGRFLHPTRGYLGRTALPAAAMERNAAVIGPPGSGKTQSFLVPWIVAGLRAGYSVATVDVRGDLHREIREQVDREGRAVGVRARSLDYGDPSRSVSWNWVAELSDDGDVDNAVGSILGRSAPPNTDPYFFNQDMMLLRGVLELARDSPRRGRITTQSLLAMLRDREVFASTIQRYPGSAGAERLRPMLSLSPDDLDRRVSGVIGRLDVLARPTLARVSTRPEFFVDEVLSEPQLFTVVAPVRDGQMAQMLSALFFSRLLYHAYERFGSTAPGVPLLLVLDEAPQLAERIDIATVLSLARAAGVTVILAMQDVGQFADENERTAILSNCGTLVTVGSVSDASARVVSARLGEHPVLATSSTRAPGSRGGTTFTRSTTTAPVLGMREIMHPPFGVRPAMVHSRELSSRPFFVEAERA